MDEILERVFSDLVARTTGPMWFRLILQPLVAVVFGIRAGLANLRRHPAGGPRLANRQAMFRQAAGDVGKVFVVGLVLDAIFQFLALNTVYPGEALLVAFLLVALPYQIVRSLVTWIVGRR